jgi:hypothetical protein
MRWGDPARRRRHSSLFRQNLLSRHERTKARGEMPQDGRLRCQLEPRDRLGVAKDFRCGVGRMLELARCVDAPWDRQTDQLERRAPVLAGDRIPSSHDRSDFDAADAAGEVERTRQCLGRKAVGPRCGSIGPAFR